MSTATATATATETGQDSAAQQRIDSSFAYRDATTPRVKLSTVSTHRLDRQHWLWPGRVPLEAVTLLAGEPGLGKSLLTLDLAARLSRQLPFPDGAPNWSAPVSSMLLSGEDSPSVQHRRLVAMGADLERVLLFEGIEENGRTRSFDPARHFEAMSKALESHPQVRLMVIDPLPCFTGKLDPQQPRSARRIIQWLAALARSRGLAILAVTHLSKAQGYRGLERVLGAVSLTAAARAAHFVAKDPADPARRLLLTGKQNLSTEAPGLAYRITTDEGGEPRLDWEPGPVTEGLEDLLRPRRNRACPQRDRACDFLLAKLHDGPRRSVDLFAEARASGLSIETLRKAKRDLTVRSEKHGNAPGSAWTWHLPDGKTAEAQPEADTIDLGGISH